MKAGVTDRLWSINLTTTVPLNMNVLRAMRRSPLGIDLYLWLTLTTFRILQKKKKSLKLYWRQLYQQFGAEPQKMTDQRVEWFRNDAIRELKKLHLAWPELQYRVVWGSRRKGREKEGHLILGVTPPPPRYRPEKPTGDSPNSSTDTGGRRAKVRRLGNTSNRAGNRPANAGRKRPHLPVDTGVLARINTHATPARERA